MADKYTMFYVLWTLPIFYERQTHKHYYDHNRSVITYLLDITFLYSFLLVHVKGYRFNRFEEISIQNVVSK